MRVWYISHQKGQKISAFICRNFEKRWFILKQFEQIYDVEERKKRLKKNVRLIKKSLDSLDKDVLKLNEQLIEEAAMYATTLQEINEIITRDGIVDFYQNGENQWGTKKSVAAELKPKYTSTYQSLIRQLSDLLPSENEKDAAKEIMDFLQGK